MEKLTRRDVLTGSLAALLAPRGSPLDGAGGQPDPGLISAATAASRIRVHAVTATECVEAVLALAEARRDLNAFTTLDPDGARRAAWAADAAAASGSRLRPLHGVPVAIKDTIDTADLPTSYANRALIGHRPTADAEVVRRLRAAGAIVVGKTNCDEFNFGNFSEDSAFGRVRNPFDPDRITGGSSGGSAAAVAAGIVPVALGADTTGSVRVPAALTGCCGFRPSTGRYPTDGIWPISPTLDSPGLFAREVADLLLLDSVLASPPVRTVATTALRGARIGVPRRYFYELLDPASAAVIEASLRVLSRADIHVVEVDMGDVGPLVAASAYPILLAEAAESFRDFIRRQRIPYSLEQLVETMTSRVQRLWHQYALEDAPEHPSPSAKATARTAAREVRRRYLNYFARHDLVAMAIPATPFPATRSGELTISLGCQSYSVFDVIERCTAPGSVAAAPGLVMPVGRTRLGLPIALQFDARPGDDRTLLELGRVIEPVFNRAA